MWFLVSFRCPFFMSFWCFLASFWLPFGSLLGPFGSLFAPFGSLWPPLAPLGPRLAPSCPPWLPVGSLLHVLVSRWLPFGSLLGPFWHPLASWGKLGASFLQTPWQTHLPGTSLALPSAFAFNLPRAPRHHPSHPNDRSCRPKGCPRERLAYSS